MLNKDKIKYKYNYSGAAVYALIDEENGKIYIGSSENVDRRIKQHNYSMNASKCSNKLQKSVDDGHTFHVEILEKIPDGKDYFYMFENEAEWIEKLDSIRLGYNTAKTTASSRKELEQTLQHCNPKSEMYKYICGIIKKREKIIKSKKCNETIVIRVAKEEKYEIQTHAEKCGESASEFILRAVKETIIKDNSNKNKEK